MISKKSNQNRCNWQVAYDEYDDLNNDVRDDWNVDHSVNDISAKHQTHNMERKVN